MAKEKKEVIPLHQLEINGGELAAIVGKSPRWIRRLTTDGILTKVDRGKYILGDSIQAYVEHIQGGKEEDNKPRYIDHKTEHERIKSEKAALELAQMRGELHDAGDVEAVMADMLTAFRQKILGIPSKLAPQLVEIDDVGTVKSRLTKELHEALSELSNYNPDMFREGTTAGADEDGQT